MPKQVGRIKAQILEQEGLVYDLKRKIYVDLQRRKVLSLKAILANNRSWLCEKITEPSDPNGWQFYFNQKVSDKVKRGILRDVVPDL